MTSRVRPLAGDFPPPSVDDWRAEVTRVLNRGRPPGRELSEADALARLTRSSVDGIVRDPLPPPYRRPLGHPGVMPFTRGSDQRAGLGTAWDVAALHEDPDVEFGNAAVLADLTGGATSLWLRIDPDAVAPGDLPAMVAGVELDLAPVRVSSRTAQGAAAHALARLWRSSGHAPVVRGNLGVDPLAAAAATGEGADWTQAVEWARAARAEFPMARALSVDVTGYDDAGAGDVDLLAFAIATGISYLRALDAAGIGPADACAQIEFRVPVHADVFLTVARLRALRRVWARVGEVVGVPEQARAAHQHAVTSWRTLTRDAVWVNQIRHTVAAFAAAVGGAESVTVRPHDAVWGLPSEFSRRMARNVQLVAAEEAHLGLVSDPGGGSASIEALTEQLAERAWARVQAIEAIGGMEFALARGRVGEWMAETRAARDVLLRTRRRPITGVSTFPAPAEPAPTIRPRPVRAPVSGLPPLRDSAPFERLRDRVARAGGRPPVVLLGMGPASARAARLQWVTDLLRVAGLPSRVLDGPDPAAWAGDSTIVDGVVILCGAADSYASAGAGTLRALGPVVRGGLFLTGSSQPIGDETARGLLAGELVEGMDVVDALDELIARWAGDR